MFRRDRRGSIPAAPRIRRTVGAMEWADGILLIAASGVGAICGILGQSIRDWLSRPRISIMASADEHSNTLLLFFINTGRKSTEGLAIDVAKYDEDAQIGSVKIIFHTTDITMHPKTAQTLQFGCIEDRVLRIKKSDFGKVIRYSDDSEEGQEEWVFPFPVNFYVSACAKDARAHVKIVSVDRSGIRIKNPKGISYGMLKGQSAPNDDKQ